MEYKSLVMGKPSQEIIDVILDNVLQLLRDNDYDIDVGCNVTVNFPQKHNVPADLVALANLSEEQDFLSYTEFQGDSFRMFTFRYRNRLAISSWRWLYGLAVFCDDVTLATHLKLACL